MGEGEGSARKVCKNCQRHTCRGKNEGQQQRRAHKHDHCFRDPHLVHIALTWSWMYWVEASRNSHPGACCSRATSCCEAPEEKRWT